LLVKALYALDAPAYAMGAKAATGIMALEPGAEGAAEEIMSRVPAVHARAKSA
jgi:sterol 3beta-glucosyltransferase